MRPGAGFASATKKQRSDMKTKNLADMADGGLRHGSIAVLTRASDEGIAVGSVEGFAGAIVITYGPSQGDRRMTRQALGLGEGVRLRLLLDSDGGLVGAVAPILGAAGEEVILSANRSLAMRAIHREASR